jgi:hypothetical protein
LSTKDEGSSGRPTQATVPENVDAIDSMILDNRRSNKNTEEILAISRERVGYIIQVILDMRKLSAKWVIKCLFTMKETWIHICYPETKEQSEELRQSGSPCPKKFKTHKSSSKVLAPVFWDNDGILLVGCLENGETITAKYSVALLDTLKQQLVSKRRGKLSKGILFLQDYFSA